MSALPPQSQVDDSSDVLHGRVIVDPYRWLEDQDSNRTRAWLKSETEYTRHYLDSIAGREQIRHRVREFLAVESIDSLLIVQNQYIFRLRRAAEEQGAIYLRSGPMGSDHLLLDPRDIDPNPFTSIRPLQVSRDARLLLFEIKYGGERMSRFGLLDVATRKRYPEELPHGYLRGFAFSPDNQGFYYVHDPEAMPSVARRFVRYHALGTRFDEDTEVFSVPGDQNTRLHVVPGKNALGFLIYCRAETTRIDFYHWDLQAKIAVPILRGVSFSLGPRLHSSGRIFAITDQVSANLSIVELKKAPAETVDLQQIVPPSNVRIDGWLVTEHWICVSYRRSQHTSLDIFNLEGRKLREVIVPGRDTIRLLTSAADSDEIFFERESFAVAPEIYRYPIQRGRASIWTKRKAPIEVRQIVRTEVSFLSKDGVEIPMFLVGGREASSRAPRPTILTSYGGFGASVTPQFSVLTMYLIERGCLFALPQIRGGSDFGAHWHEAARGRRRQVAFDDFLCAAEWLISSGHADPNRLAIFGGSNSGLLVLAAMTQRPDLFRAVLAIAPLADMLRYHLFDQARFWRREFGTSEDSDDFTALLSYSPYHNVQDGAAYPATMIVSGDRDQNCNALHARKMTARLQAANRSVSPIILDYHPLRGHSPVLPLSLRVDALTDRLAFLVEQLGLEP